MTILSWRPKPLSLEELSEAGKYHIVAVYGVIVHEQESRRQDFDDALSRFF